MNHGKSMSKQIAPAAALSAPPLRVDLRPDQTPLPRTPGAFGRNRCLRFGFRPMPGMRRCILAVLNVVCCHRLTLICNG
jgi:hypothetical protein